MYHKVWTRCEPLAIPNLLHAQLVGFVVSGSLISHTPPHVNYLKFQSSLLTVSPQARINISHETISLLRGICIDTDITLCLGTSTLSDVFSHCVLRGRLIKIKCPGYCRLSPLTRLTAPRSFAKKSDFVDLTFISTRLLFRVWCVIQTIHSR